MNLNELKEININDPATDLKELKKTILSFDDEKKQEFLIELIDMYDDDKITDDVLEFYKSKEFKETFTNIYKQYIKDDDENDEKEED